MKFFVVLFLSGSCSLVWAQTNAAAPKPEQQLVITSDSGRFDGKASRMLYLGHVFVTDNVKAKLYCGQLTVDLPADGSHPTNIMAETDLVIDYLDGKGQTNRITADKAVYAYSVLTNKSVIVTNETVTFTGGKPKPKIVNPQATILSEPLIYDAVANQFVFSHYETHFNLKPGNDTNASPFNFLK